MEDPEDWTVRDHCSDNTGPVLVGTAKREKERILNTDFLRECNFWEIISTLGERERLRESKSKAAPDAVTAVLV